MSKVSRVFDLAFRCILTVILLSPTAPALGQTGQFLDEFGAGVRAMAMGQAFTAVADDYSAAYYNPAGLTRIEHIFESANAYIYMAVHPRVRFRDEPDENIDADKPLHGLHTGIASNLDIERLIAAYPWLEPLAFGLVSWLNLPEINQYYTTPYGHTPHFLRYSHRFQLLSMAISFAYRVTPWLSVGAGAMPNITSVSTQSSFEALNMIDDPVQGQRLSIHQTAKVFISPIAGLLVSPPQARWRDRISMGLSYRGQIKSFHGKGPLLEQGFGIETEEGRIIPLFTIPMVRIINLVSFNPHQITAGVAARPHRGWLISVDLTWKDYSDYRTFIDEVPDPAFRDTWVPRLGLEYCLFMDRDTPLGQLRSLSLQTGYYFEPTPVRGMSGPHNILDADQDVFSFGFAADLFAGGMDHLLEGFFQTHRLRPITADNENDPFYGPMVIDGLVFGGGISYTTKF